MSYRFMRVIVLFDIPTTTYEYRREYVRFRKFLLKNGFIMVQESVYSKIALNSSTANFIAERVRKNKPEVGLVQMLTITEKQYSKMELICGEEPKEVLDSDERLVIL